VRRALGSILEVTSRERRNLAIALRDGGELIGIWATNWRARRRSLVYMVSPDHWGLGSLGYATEAW